MASQVGKSYEVLLSSNVAFIYVHLVLSCERHAFLQKARWLEEETGLGIGSLLRQSFQAVINQLLLYLGSRGQQIKAGRCHRYSVVYLWSWHVVFCTVGSLESNNVVPKWYWG